MHKIPKASDFKIKEIYDEMYISHYEKIKANIIARLENFLTEECWRAKIERAVETNSTDIFVWFSLSVNPTHSKILDEVLTPLGYHVTWGDYTKVYEIRIKEDMPPLSNRYEE